MAKSNVTINEYAISLPQKVRDWLAEADKIMLDI